MQTHFLVQIFSTNDLSLKKEFVLEHLIWHSDIISMSKVIQNPPIEGQEAHRTATVTVEVMEKYADGQKINCLFIKPKP